MRRKLLVLLTGIFFLFSQTVFPISPDTSYERIGPTHIFRVPAYSGAAGDEGVINLAFLLKREFIGLCFTLWVATRGANDSLLITIQTSPNPEDSTNWQTLTTFDGRKAATGFTIRCFPTGTAARDSTTALFPFFRISSDHSIDAVGASDSSTWFLFIQQYGTQ